MCTLLTVSADKFSRALEQHIRHDAMYNPHGFACLMLGKDGADTIIRSMSIDTILLVLRNSEWNRMFLHSRYATQGVVRLDTTHGWAEEGVFYFHNGCLSSADADMYEVDSQAIGLWLQRGGTERALEGLKTEAFANVFMVDVVSGMYVVSRSPYGSLYTDKEGNFATVPCGEINIAVVPGTVEHWRYADQIPEISAEIETELEQDIYDEIQPATDEELENISQWRLAMGDDVVIGDDGIEDFISPSLRKKLRA